MVKLTWPRSTSRSIWYSLGIKPRSRNSRPTSSRPRTHKVQYFYVTCIFFLQQQLQASRESLLKKADEVERKLRECETEKNRVDKELKDLKQTNNKTTKTLKDLRLDVNVMLRNILNEVCLDQLSRLLLSIFIIVTAKMYGICLG